MAIITCPECGEKISDKVNQCIHCGVSISVCPECQKVYIEKVKTCTDCGYVFKEEKAETGKKKSHGVKTAKEVMSRWEGANSLQKLLASNVVWMLLLGASLVCIAIAAVTLFGWNNAFEANEVFSNVKTFVILSAVFYTAFSIIGTFGDYNKVINLFSWCNSQSINLESTIRNTLELDYDTLTIEDASAELYGTDWCLRAVSYDKDAIMRMNIKKYNIGKIVFSAVFTFFLAAFAIKNVEIYMQAEMLKSDLLGTSGFEFNMIEDWWMLIVAAVAFIINHFLGKHVGNLEEAANKNYVVKNLPEYLSKYNKYVTSDGVAEYLLERGEKADN